MKLTYIDSGVLIVAFRGEKDLQKRAMAFLGDTDREFASSFFTRLEVLPKAVYHKQQYEIEFYNTFFQAVTAWANLSEQLLEEAYQEACQIGASAMDALHIAAAASVKADEFITTERPEKPIHRTRMVKVIAI